MSKREWFDDIQAQLGYKFKNPDLLVQAFTRKTYALENGGAPAEVKTEEPTTEEVTTEEQTTEATTEYVEPETEEASYSNSSDLYLLAAIVYAEAGNQSYEGQLAVASVVMNRLYSGSFGGSLSEIIYAPSQFTAVYSTAFSTALSTGGSSTSPRQ